MDGHEYIATLAALLTPQAPGARPAALEAIFTHHAERAEIGTASVAVLEHASIVIAGALAMPMTEVEEVALIDVVKRRRAPFCRPVDDWLRTVAARPAEGYDAIPWRAREAVHDRRGDWVAHVCAAGRTGEVAAELGRPWVAFGVGRMVGRFDREQTAREVAGFAPALAAAWHALPDDIAAALAGPGLLRWVGDEGRERALRLAPLVGDRDVDVLDDIAAELAFPDLSLRACAALLDVAEHHERRYCREAVRRAALSLDAHRVRAGLTPELRAVIHRAIAAAQALGEPGAERVLRRLLT